MADEGVTRSEAAVDTGFSGRRSLVLVMIVCATLLVSGLAFRLSGGSSGQINQTPLRVPLTEFPYEFLGYQWSKDRVLDENTERVLGAMAYLNRDGFRDRDKSRASLWVSYYGESKTDLQHEPEVCMIAGGWSMPAGRRTFELPMTRSPGYSADKLMVGVYVFERDLNYLLVVNTHCINRKYIDSRDTARLMGDVGSGFYAQVRVTIPISKSDLPPGGIEQFYKRITGAGNDDKDARWLAEGLARLDAPVAEGDVARAHPFFRAVEIMRHVVPELDRFFPLTEKPAK
jgi:hypothetical protein